MSDSYQAIYDAVRSRIHGGDVGQAIRDAAHLDASMAIESVRCQFVLAAECMAAPSAIYRPAIMVDGNKWCALYGENIQDGVAGIGDTPAEAMAAFDVAWHTKLDNWATRNVAPAAAKAQP